MTDDERVARWTSWVRTNGAIHLNVVTMHLHRAAWRQVQEIVVANGSLPDSYWWEFLRDTYATTQVTAVRRQTDVRRDAASLARLLVELRPRPQLLSRELALAPVADRDWIRQAMAAKVWDEHAGGGDFISRDIVDADTATLNDAAGEVTRYVNEHVAHTKAQPVPAEVTVTLDDVHDAVDQIAQVFRRYSLLLAGGAGGLEPVIQHDWLAVFRVPWIKPRGS